jgi:hypothetical protein
MATNKLNWGRVAFYPNVIGAFLCYNKGNNLSSLSGVKCAMNPSRHWHSDAAHSAIVFLRHQSPNAAAALAQILNTYGDRAAYQASIALIQLKTDVEKMGEAKTLEQYESGMLEFQNTLPLLRRALRWFLIDYGMGVKKSRQAQLDSASLSAEDELPLN